MKKILLGVTSGVAVYKACEIVRLLKKQGHEVKVMMTPNAAGLVSPCLFESLSCNPVYFEMFSRTEDYSVQHISLAQWADAVLIAPCTLSTLSKIAFGICDNLLTTVFMALPRETPKFIAPAMNSNMWENPITRDNAEKIKKLLNVTIIGPGNGELACGQIGVGTLANVDDIVKHF